MATTTEHLVFQHGSLTFTTVDQTPFTSTIETGCQLCGILDRATVKRGELFEWRQTVMDEHNDHVGDYVGSSI